MTNQQLAETCRDILAEADKYDLVIIEIVEKLLPCLEAEPKALLYRWAPPHMKMPDGSQFYGEWRIVSDAILANPNANYERENLYTAPPVPEMRQIKLPEQIYVREPGFIGWVYDADEIEEAIKAAEIEVKS